MYIPWLKVLQLEATDDNSPLLNDLLIKVTAETQTRDYTTDGTQKFQTHLYLLTFKLECFKISLISHLFDYSPHLILFVKFVGNLIKNVRV